MPESNIDSLIRESSSLAAQVKEIENRRSQIANTIKKHMIEEDVDRIFTDDGLTAVAYPVIDPPFGQIEQSDRRKLIDWLYEHHPNLLTVIHTRLSALVADDPESLPVQFTTSGYSVRVLTQKTTKPARPLSTVQIKTRAPRYKSQTPTIPVVVVDNKTLDKIEYEIYSQPLNGDEVVKTWSMSKEEIMSERVRQYRIERAKEVDNMVKEYKAKKEAEKIVKQYEKNKDVGLEPRTHLGLTREQRIQRKADIIQRYMNGEKKSHIAKIYGLSGGYVGELLKKHERQLLKEMINSNKPNKPKDDRPPMLSVEL
jgi:hypothetical protein